jgi:signal transduction histidine kinase
MKFPEYIFNYFRDKEIVFDPKAYINIDRDGKILDYEGRFKNYFEKSPKVGRNIEEIDPVFLNLFGLNQDIFEIPNYQGKKNRYVDIIIFISLVDAWILLIEKTEDVKLSKAEIQKRNEDRLKNYKEFKNETSIFSHILSLNEVAVFEKSDENSFRLIGQKPDWLEKLFPGLSVGDQTVIEDRFLFLEYFINHRIKELEDDKEIVNSNLWIESVDDKDIYLQAVALTFKDKVILTINLVDSDCISNQHLVQKAREKNLELESLEKSKKELNKLLDFREKFVSIISHDLRSPIMGATEFSNMLLLDDELQDVLSPKHREYLGYIKQSIGRLADYTQKMYQWSNLELGRFKLNIEKISLNNLFEELLHTFIPLANDKQIKLEYKIEGDVLINIDETLFYQVLNNLISNAIKFTEKGGRITFGCENIHDGLIVYVQDDGVGIPKEKQTFLFKEQFIGSTYGTAKEKGFGIGLSIVKRILDAHNFKITCASEKGSGTIFKIYLKENQ